MNLIRLFGLDLIKRRHNYYSNSGFYSYLKKNVLKVLLILIVVFVLFFILEKWVIDFNDFFHSFFKNMQTESVLLLFSVSESLFGLIPPDFFIIWARKFSQPWLVITLLAIISYLGGLVSYFIGRKVRKIKLFNNYLTEKFDAHFKKIKRWGALFIIVAALFPLPYSTICMLSGILKFPFKVFAFIGITRMLRFYFYALVLFGLIK